MLLNWSAFARADRSCDPWGYSGPHGIPARLELWASPARAVLPRARPESLRALLRRGAAHGDPPRRRLLFLAGPHTDGLRFLTVVRAHGSRQRPRSAARLPRDRLYRARGFDRVSIRGFLREHRPLTVGGGLQLRPSWRPVPRRRSRG